MTDAVVKHFESMLNSDNVGPYLFEKKENFNSNFNNTVKKEERKESQVTYTKTKNITLYIITVSSIIILTVFFILCLCYNMKHTKKLNHAEKNKTLPTAVEYYNNWLQNM